MESCPLGTLALISACCCWLVALAEVGLHLTAFPSLYDGDKMTFIQFIRGRFYTSLDALCFRLQMEQKSVSFIHHTAACYCIQLSLFNKAPEWIQASPPPSITGTDRQIRKCSLHDGGWLDGIRTRAPASLFPVYFITGHQNYVG